MRKHTLLVLCSILFASYARGQELYKANLLLNLYDAPNIQYSYKSPRNVSGRADVCGVFVGSNSAEGFLAIQLGEVIVQSIYTEELKLENIDIDINLRGNSFTNNASIIEYTNSISGGWQQLVDNISGSTNLVLGTDFTVTEVQGLRWVLPADNWHTNTTTQHFFEHPYTPQIKMVNAWGTNTVPVDYKLNLVAAKYVAITTNVLWGAHFKSGKPLEIADQVGHISAFSAKKSPDREAYLQIEFDQKYKFDTFIMHWGKANDVRRAPNSYDISVSTDGNNWVKVVDDHNSTSNATATHDTSDVSEMNAIGKFVRIHDLQGHHSWEWVQLCEVQAYGEIAPQAGTVLLIN